jgi:predicted ATPase
MVPAGYSVSEIGKIEVLGRYERVFAVMAADHEVRGSTAVRTTLPFIGRRYELADIRRLLDQSRLVTVYGLPGVGKTAILRRLFADAEEEFSEGAWQVDLQSILQSAMVLPALHRLLDIVTLPTEDGLSALCNSIGERRALLILDNVQKVQPAVRLIVSQLLESCPQLAILVGSQRVLRLSGESRYRLQGLECPAYAEHWNSVRDYDAVALFEDRARMVDQDFRVQEQNASDVAMLCQRLDGNPLAIELAASKTTVLSPRQILGRLSDRFVLLKDQEGKKVLLETIRWAIELLGSDAQVLLRRLAVFRAAFSVESATAVCTDQAQLREESVLSGLEELVECGVLGTSRIQAGEKLFYLCETLRAFALGELRSHNEYETYKLRHRKWCLELASTVCSDLDGSDSHFRFARLDASYEDLRQAILDGTVARRYVSDSIELLLAVQPFLFARNYYSEGLHLCERVIQTAESPRHPEYSRLLNLASAFSFFLQDRETSTSYAVRAIRAARSSHHAVYEGSAWSGLALAYQLIPDMQRSLRAYRKAIRLFEAGGDRHRLLNAYGNAIGVAADAGEAEWALDLLPSLEPELGVEANTFLRAHIHQNAAHLFLVGEQPEQALRYALRTLLDFNEIGNMQGVGTSLRTAVRSLVMMERWEDAALLMGAERQVMAGTEATVLVGYEDAYEQLQSLVQANLGQPSFGASLVEGQSASLQELVKSVQENW